MRRYFIPVIVGAAVLVGLGALVVLQGPSPTTAASTPMPAAGVPPGVGASHQRVDPDRGEAARGRAAIHRDL